jgi:hypothetical protein
MFDAKIVVKSLIDDIEKEIQNVSLKSDSGYREDDAYLGGIVEGLEKTRSLLIEKLETL